ncbi:hypothetical protein BSKO_09800 [Bryopsis sp. KO-2023]|nr:hypothetical protein BSKO_09800 [Bryopsis sp. KO-2023]
MAQPYAPIGDNSGAKGWKNRWWECCGDCDDHGWGICCIGNSVPFVLYGWNRARAFATSGLKWGVFFLLPVIVMYICSTVSESGVSQSILCARDPQFCGDTLRGEQNFKLNATQIIFMVISILAYCAFVALGWYNRNSLRQKYGLPGNNCTDCLLWFFCSPCAVCQESRTLDYNNVENGVWMGPDVMLVPKSGQAAAPVYAQPTV